MKYMIIFLSLIASVVCYANQPVYNLNVNTGYHEIREGETITFEESIVNPIKGSLQHVPLLICIDTYPNDPDPLYLTYEIFVNKSTTPKYTKVYQQVETENTNYNFPKLTELKIKVVATPNMGGRVGIVRCDIHPV